MDDFARNLEEILIFLKENTCPFLSNCPRMYWARVCRIAHQLGNRPLVGTTSTLRVYRPQLVVQGKFTTPNSPHIVGAYLYFRHSRIKI